MKDCRNKSTPKLLKALPKNMGVTAPEAMSSGVGGSPRICVCLCGGGKGGGGGKGRGGEVSKSSSSSSSGS
jgi:hypothetical protein